MGHPDAVYEKGQISSVMRPTLDVHMQELKKVVEREFKDNQSLDVSVLDLNTELIDRNPSPDQNVPASPSKRLANRRSSSNFGVITAM